MVARAVAQQQIAHRVMTVRQQGADRLGIAPFVDAGRQAQADGMAVGIGPPQKTLRPHVEQPPGHALAVQLLTLLLLHHVAVRSHGDQQAQTPNPALGIDPVHRQVGKAPVAIAQQVLNGSGGAEPHHLVAQPAQRA